MSDQPSDMDDCDHGIERWKCHDCHEAEDIAARARIATLEADLARVTGELEREREARYDQGRLFDERLRDDRRVALAEREGLQRSHDRLLEILSGKVALEPPPPIILKGDAADAFAARRDLEEARRLLERVKATGRLSDMLDDVLLDDMDALLSRFKSTPG